MIKRIKFLGIPVRDQDRALRFYTEKLGFRIFTDQQFSDTQRWIELSIPGAETGVVLFTPQGHEDRIDYTPQGEGGVCAASGGGRRFTGLRNVGPFRRAGRSSVKDGSTNPSQPIYAAQPHSPSGPLEGKQIHVGRVLAKRQLYRLGHMHRRQQQNLIDFDARARAKLGRFNMIVKREWLATIAAAFLLAASVQAQDLPNGAGKDLVMNVCTVCHEVTRITSKKRSKEEWSDTVDKMAARGAKASDEEFETIVTYLAKYFGKDQPSGKTN